jgi:fructose-bisphosphate aldolase class II
MALVSIEQELVKAQAGKYAVPLFDVFDTQGMDGLMEAMTARRAPTIIGIYSAFAERPTCRALTAYIRSRAEETEIPISIMLDHGASPELCFQVISYGFTDVMYDGSKLPLEENIANTRRVIERAHDLGVAVEAELGHVGMGSQYDQFGGMGLGFTDPGAVENFVEQTGVDFLAIAFGNAHGFYKGEPHLNLELLNEVRRRVPIPLVMHGGTGLSDEQFRSVIEAGISKINFATSIIVSAGEKMRQIASEPKSSMFDMLGGISSAYCEWSTHLYDVFGASNRA